MEILTTQKGKPQLALDGYLYIIDKNDRKIYWKCVRNPEWRKISELGLRTKYVDDLDFSLKVRMFTALAFLPPDSVRHAFQEIKPLLPPEAEDFALYFERTYIGQYSSADTGTDALRPPWGIFVKKI